MPPFYRRMRDRRKAGHQSDSSSTEASTSEQAPIKAAQRDPSLQTNSNNTSLDLSKQRKADRLTRMVDELQRSMEGLMEKRSFYAERSADLEKALKENAPVALSQCISMRTIQAADIMMELEDLNEKIASQEEQIQNMRHDQEREKRTMQVRLEQSISRYGRLKAEAEEKEQDLRDKIAQSNQETMLIQKKFAKVKLSYHTCTKNIATMATKIASLQRENRGLREEADTKHQTLVQMEQKLEELQSQNSIQQDTRKTSSPSSSSQRQSSPSVLADPAESDSFRKLRSELESSKFENEMLIAERTANQSVISELRKQVQELLQTLQANQSSQQVNAVPNDAVGGAATPPRSNRALRESQVPPEALDSSGVEERFEKTKRLEPESEGLSGVVSSMSSQSNQNNHECSFQGAHSASACFPACQQGAVAESQKHEASSTPSPVHNTPPCSASIPMKARRMKIVINDMEGSYTGPLGTDGLPNGTGTIRFRNGDTYLGQLQNGKLHGKGTMYTKGKPTVRDQQYENNLPVE